MVGSFRGEKITGGKFYQKKLFNDFLRDSQVLALTRPMLTLKIDTTSGNILKVAPDAAFLWRASRN